MQAKYKARNHRDPETGEEHAQFECPECGEWNFMIHYDKVAVLQYKCKKCGFEENENIFPEPRHRGH